MPCIVNYVDYFNFLDSQQNRDKHLFGTTLNLIQFNGI